MLKRFILETFESKPEGLTMETLTKEAENQPFYKWKHKEWLRRSAIRLECTETDLLSLMLSLQSMEMLLLQNAIWSKKKDFVRGRKIMDVVVGVGGHS